MAPPQSMTVAEVARQEGISTATLYNWRKVARERGAVLPSRSSTPGQWSSEDKFRVVLETASLSEAEFSEYCRSNGLLPERSEEHTSELQSRGHLVCRLLLEKKNR